MPETVPEAEAGTRMQFGGLRLVATDSPSARWMKQAAAWAGSLEEQSADEVESSDSGQTVRVESGSVVARPGEQAARLWTDVRAEYVGGDCLFEMKDFRAAATAEGRVVFQPAEHADPLAGAPLFEAVLFELLAARRYLCVHASFVARGGEGVLITGPSGAGKSTLAFLAAQPGSGVEMVTDDVVLLSAAGAGWSGISTSQELRLLPLRDLPDVETSAVDPDGKHRVRVDSRRMSAPVSRVVVLDSPPAAHHETALAGREEVLSILLSQTALALRPDVVDRQLEMLSELSTLPARRIRAGADLLNSPAAVCSMLFDW